jgi:hypothetical protein
MTEAAGENPENLSASELLDAVRDSLSSERLIVCRFLVLLMELDRRQLYRNVGFPSLFHWLTRGLGLSESSAAKRIQVTRLLTRLPNIRESVFAMLRAGDMHLAGLSVLAPHLTAENADKILADAKGRTRLQMESMIVSLGLTNGPATSAKPWIRIMSAELSHESGKWPAPDQGTDKNPEQARDQDPDEIRRQISDFAHDRRPAAESTGHCRSSSASGNQGRDHLKDRLKDQGLAIRLAVTLIGDGARDLLRLRELFPWHDPGRIIHEALSLLRKTRDFPATKLPRETQRQVFARDGHQCTFVSDDGVRCPARGRLQIDHILPRAKGGDDRIENLRLLCAAHNQLMAERHFGRDFMRQRMSERQFGSSE